LSGEGIIDGMTESLAALLNITQGDIDIIYVQLLCPFFESIYANFDIDKRRRKIRSRNSISPNSKCLKSMMDYFLDFASEHWMKWEFDDSLKTLTATKKLEK